MTPAIPSATRSRRPVRAFVALSLLVASTSGAPAGAQGLWDDPAFALYRQAAEAIERKDYAAARRLAGEAVAAYPDHVLAHYLLAQAAVAESRWPDAVAALEKVAALYPASFAAQRELSIALEQLDRVDDARRAYTRALALRADHEDTRVRLAFLVLRAGDRDAAFTELAALAAAQSAVPEVWTTLARLHYERGDLRASERAFTRAVGLRDDGRSWFNLAVVRYRLDDRAGSLAAFERAAQHPAVREQALREIDKLREAAEAAPSGRGGPTR
jgi:tetratricopeptide (TPR) repeat protein